MTNVVYLNPRQRLTIGQLQAEYQRLLNQLVRCHDFGLTGTAIEIEDKLSAIRARIQNARATS